MNTKLLLTMLLAGAFLTPMALRAEDTGHEHDKDPHGGAMCACMKEKQKDPEPKKKMMMMGMDKMDDMKAKMKAEEAELQKLVDVMNTTTGDKKTEAIAALLNKMVQTHKAMCEKMEKMAAGPTKPTAKPEAKPKEDTPPQEETQKAEPADPHAGHQH